MHKFILTIIVPIYNTEKYIEKCLNSIDPNNNKNIELIIINDGSTDNSLSIVMNILKKNNLKNYIIINKKNEGHGPAIQLGIEKAKGKYLRILDSDDWFEKEALLEHIDFLKKSDSTIVLTDYRRVIQINDNATKNYKYVMFKIDNLKTNEILKINLKNECNKYSSRQWNEFKKTNSFLILSNFVLPRISIKSDIIQKYKFSYPKNTNQTDVIYLFICRFLTDSVAYQPICLYNYFIGRNEQSANPSRNIKLMWKNTVSHWKILLSINEISNSEIANTPILKVYLRMYIRNQLLTYVRELQDWFDLYKIITNENSLPSGIENINSMFCIDYENLYNLIENILSVSEQKFILKKLNFKLAKIQYHNFKNNSILYNIIIYFLKNILFFKRIMFKIYVIIFK